MKRLTKILTLTLIIVFALFTESKSNVTTEPDTTVFVIDGDHLVITVYPNNSTETIKYDWYKNGEFDSSTTIDSVFIKNPNWVVGTWYCIMNYPDGTTKQSRNFISKKVYSLETEVNDTIRGYILGNPKIAEPGTTITLEAIETNNSIFKGWYEDGSLISEDLQYQFDIDKNSKISAYFLAYSTIVFKEKLVDNLVTSGFLYGELGEVTSTLSGAGTYLEDDEMTITVKPVDGCRIMTVGLKYTDSDGKGHYIWGTGNLYEPATFTFNFLGRSEYELEVWFEGTPTGINDKDISKIEVYPNPAIDYINIVNNNLGNDLILNIFDNKGTLIKRVNDFYNQQIAISDLNQGMYFLQILENDTVKYIGKFIKK